MKRRNREGQLSVLTAYYFAAIWVSLYFKWWSMISLHELIHTMPLVIAPYIFVTAISNTQASRPGCSSSPSTRSRRSSSCRLSAPPTTP
ncbi:MAG: hypothetical protein H0W90_04455 [Actinobacteria bacterium]|nr:hypothetical protein [Actinomycetota bacterium]